MATQKVWNVNFVAGNPALFNKVITASDGPFLRGQATKLALEMVGVNPAWRIWVEHVSKDERLFESAAEILHRKQLEASKGVKA